MQGLCHAFDLDETVDDEIRKNYKDTKLINDMKLEVIDENENNNTSLPKLPDVVKTSSNKSLQTSTLSKTTNQLPPNIGNTKIAKHTIFNVTSSNSISDSMHAGTTIKFTMKNAMNKKNYTIPAGTTFIGEITESHPPQITCNGGLVSIRINSMVYKGQNIPINAYITKANSKNIFLNDIKGKRTYLSTMWKKGNWGRTMFNRMLTLTVNLGSDGSTLILAPFPFLYGSICVGLNTLTSPITAFFSKGGHVSIPSGSPFRIKLTNEVYIN
ncbi:MAG: hypothetical protein MJ237_06490 [bacterium]|nr:hypothetical protein [bacterium]